MLLWSFKSWCNLSHHYVRGTLISGTQTETLSRLLLIALAESHSKCYRSGKSPDGVLRFNLEPQLCCDWINCKLQQNNCYFRSPSADGGRSNISSFNVVLHCLSSIWSTVVVLTSIYMHVVVENGFWLFSSFILRNKGAYTRPNFSQPSSRIALVNQSFCSHTIADRLLYD